MFCLNTLVYVQEPYIDINQLSPCGPPSEPQNDKEYPYVFSL